MLKISFVRPNLFLIVLPLFLIVPEASGAGEEVQPGNTATVSQPATNRSGLADFETIRKYGAQVKASIPALLEGLQSKESSIRRNAAFSLGEIGPEAETAINDLAKALRNDPDMEVRRNAAFALGEIGSPSLPVLIEVLSDRDSRVRRNVAAALVRIGHPAVPSLIKLLYKGTPIMRRNTAGILGRIGPKAKDAIPALKKALEGLELNATLDDNDKAFRWTLREALRKIKRFTVEDLTDSLNDKDVIIRAKAATSLGEMGIKAQSAVPALILRLNDPKAEVRKNAAFALVKIGEAALPALMQALENDNIRIRQNAAFSLGEFGEKAQKAIPALTRLLNDSNSKVRWCADIAIKKIKSPAHD